MSYYEGREPTRTVSVLGTEYRIEVRNPGHVEKGVRRILVDGEDCKSIPVFTSGTHTVEVLMGTEGDKND